MLTWSDFRRIGLELIKSSDRSWTFGMLSVPMLQRWARSASDSDVVQWLGCLPKGNAAQAGARIAVDRLRAV